MDAWHRDREGATKMVEKATGRRYCSTCNAEKPPEGGIWMSKRGVRKWKCADCVSKTKAPGRVKCDPS